MGNFTIISQSDVYPISKLFISAPSATKIDGINLNGSVYILTKNYSDFDIVLHGFSQANGSMNYSARNSLTLYDAAFSGNTTSANIKAGHYIHLLPKANLESFHIFSGTEAHIYTEAELPDCAFYINNGYRQAVAYKSPSKLQSQKNIELLFNSTSQFLIWPNPTTSKIFIEAMNNPVSFPDNQFTLELFDFSSRKILVEKFKNTLSIDLSGLSKGIYYIKINTDSQPSFFKIIHQ